MKAKITKISSDKDDNTVLVVTVPNIEVEAQILHRGEIELTQKQVNQKALTEYQQGEE